MGYYNDYHTGLNKVREISIKCFEPTVNQCINVPHPVLIFGKFDFNVKV